MPADFCRKGCLKLHIRRRGMPTKSWGYLERYRFTNTARCDLPGHQRYGGHAKELLSIFGSSCLWMDYKTSWAEFGGRGHGKTEMCAKGCTPLSRCSGTFVLTCLPAVE